jgi:PEP-CTERM motif-containing protein
MPGRRISRLAAVPLFLLILAPSPAWALSVGQRDTFEDGTTQNWIVGLLGAPHPVPPVNVPTGGPAGAGDGFLQLTAIGGGGAGSRLAVVNGAQWAGDFVVAGISGIRMDLNNLGTTDLSLRLLFADPSVGPPANVPISTAPFFLPAGGGWTEAYFPISPADLTAELGSVTAALHNTTQFRLYHGAALDFPGEPIVAALGVDNITAADNITVVPEPTTAVLLGSGLLALSWHARRRRRARA